MSNYAIFRCSKILGEAGQQEILQQMFRKFYRSQIVFRKDIFRKLTLGAPVDKSKGTCVGNDNQDLSNVVRLKLLHVLNLNKQTPFLVYFASFFGSNISTLQI